MDKCVAGVVELNGNIEESSKSSGEFFLRTILYKAVLENATVAYIQEVEALCEVNFRIDGKLVLAIRKPKFMLAEVVQAFKRLSGITGTEKNQARLMTSLAGAARFVDGTIVCVNEIEHLELVFSNQ